MPNAITVVRSEIFLKCKDVRKVVPDVVVLLTDAVNTSEDFYAVFMLQHQMDFQLRLN